MKISLDWLSDFIVWNTNDPEKIAQRLTTCTAEVERIEFLGKNHSLKKAVFHIDNHAITHRPDLFSHIGFARECVATGLAKWDDSDPISSSHSHFEWKNKEPIPFKLKVQKKSLMPRYLACMIEVDVVGKTPKWMKDRLESVGFRSLNLPIDITNYVALEVGVPLHSFDADDICGDVHMRTAKKGEKIVTLDNIQRELPEGALVLNDDKGIFDLIGIMGGLRSSTKKDTKRIYLHSASLDPVAIRKTMVTTGFRTDSGTVYEKGVSHIQTECGFYRAVNLFLALISGSRITSKLESIGDNGKAKSIKLPIENIKKTLGIEISKKEIKDIFINLGFEVKHNSSQIWSISPPLWRLSDVHEKHDLIEELGRIYGYDNIKGVIPVSSIDLPKRDTRQNRIRSSLQEDGFVELLPLSLIGSDLCARSGVDPGKTLPVVNSISHDASLLQPSVLPRLCKHAEENILHIEDILRTFTIGHVFETNGLEHTELGILVMQKKKSNLKKNPFYLIKENISHILNVIGYDATIESSNHSLPYAHAGRSGEIKIQNHVVGVLCELHPDIRSNFDLPLTAIALLDLDLLFSLESKKIIASSLPSFPAVIYDLTIAWDHKKSVAKLLKRLHAKSSLLTHIEISDIYQEDPHSSHYNLTIRCTYRAHDRTLQEEEVKKEHRNLVKSIS